MPPTPPNLNITSAVNFGQPPSAVSGLILATDVLHASAAETVTGNSTDRDYSPYRSGVLVINVTAVSGTSPTCTFVFEGKDDNAVGGSNNYWTQSVSASITAPVTLVWYFDEQSASLPVPNIPAGQTPSSMTLTQAHPLVGGTYRLRWVIGGTSPNFTFGAAVYLKPV